MAERADLLLELGVEELPAGSVWSLAENFANAVLATLTEAELTNARATVFATPRRLAVLIPQVAAAQPAREVLRRGPAVAVAFDGSGAPSKALLGFARSCNTDVGSLIRHETDKGEWMVHIEQQGGGSLTNILNTSLPNIVRQIPMPRRMRWSDQTEEFLRPVHWLVSLHGSQLLPVALLGLCGGRSTRGHRFHTGTPIELDTARDYEQKLRTIGYVEPSFARRRDIIRASVLESARAAGGVAHITAELLDEVTALVEWPVAVTGHFDPEFLKLPKEALIQTMEDNQRYFAVFDENGSLLPAFVTIVNLESSNPDSVRAGNERVIRPRFHDTVFFWDNDRKKPIISQLENLKHVLFQEQLGTLYDKTQRLVAVAEWLALKLGAPVDDCRLAARLSKCDLLSQLVTELPKMQGIAGRYYADLEGYPANISTALEEQYLPRHAGDELPIHAIGIVISMCDKTDTLVGIFGIGQKPTGTKDPFGLRRASLGLLRCLIERKIEIDLRELFAVAQKTFDDRLQQSFDLDELVQYVLDRLKGFYSDRGETGDVIDAVLATGVANPLDIDRRIRAVSGFRSTEAAEALAAANKRIRNILRKSDGAVPTAINVELLLDPAEKALALKLDQVTAEIDPLYATGDYTAAMVATASLRGVVDDFFNDVMVMAEDPSLRINRLALLQRVSNLCSRTADLSRLQTGTPI